MSQLSSSVSLPQIAHRGVPVVTTETLAQAYEVDAVSIRKNFSCNKERFTEGKHYYTLSGNDLREFKNRVTESNSVQIGKNSRSLTLWTERGAARHAKMLNSDRAWDVFELLEETFFAVVKTKLPVEQPVTLNDELISASERAELKLIVDAKLSTYPAAVQGKARAEIWAKHNRHFRIAEYSQLPARLMPEAREFLLSVRVRAINAIPTAESALPYPPLPVASSLYRDRVRALERLEQDWGELATLIRERAYGLEREFRRVTQGTYPELLRCVSSSGKTSVDALVQLMTAPTYTARQNLESALDDMRLAIRAAKTANKLMLG